MDRFDTINPLDYRYIERDEELSSKVVSYSAFDVMTKIKKIMPEILVPRLNSLRSKLQSIASENKDKEIPRRVDGRHDGKISLEEVFNIYSDRLIERSVKFDYFVRNSGFLDEKSKSYFSESQRNDFLSDIVYYTISALSVEANIADDIRQLFRNEIEEFKFKEFSTNRIGSSTMPHKINPAEFENIKSLWKAFIPRVASAILSQITEHQGDSTNEDFPYFTFELLCAVSYCSKRLENILDNTKINI